MTCDFFFSSVREQILHQNSDSTLVLELLAFYKRDTISEIVFRKFFIFLD